MVNEPMCIGLTIFVSPRCWIASSIERPQVTGSLMKSGMPDMSKSLPIDIQCSSQAIDTPVFFNNQDPENLQLALNVAK